MTHKDYELLAMQLRQAKPCEGNQPIHYRVRLEQWRDCVAVVAGAFSLDNPNFKRDKFYDACTY